KEVRDIWTKARTKFNKIRNEYELATRSGAAAIPEPDWPFYSSLKFLLGNCRKTKKRETVSTIRVQEILAKVQEQNQSTPGTSTEGKNNTTTNIYMDSSPLVVDEDVAGIIQANLPEGSLSLQSIFQLQQEEEPSSQQAKKPRVTEGKSEHAEFFSGMQQILSNIPRPPSIDHTLNADISFGNFVAATLASMEEDKKNEKKKYITQILFE
ncbi:hypothetical protein B566_EDAN018514, partial [Ephemera danica]